MRKTSFSARSLATGLFVLFGLALSCPVFAGGQTEQKVALKVLLGYGDVHRKNLHDNYYVPNSKVQLPGYTIEYELIADATDAASKLKLYNASGDLPDVFWGFGRKVSAPFVKVGNELDFTPYITKDGFINKYRDKAFVPYYTDGKIYTLQGAYDQYFTPRLFIHKDLFAKYNVPIPQTYDQLLQAVKAFNDVKILPIAIEHETIKSALIQQMIMADDPKAMADLLDNKVPITQKVFADAIDRIRQLILADAFPKNMDTIGYAEATQLFADNKAAMYMVMSWGISDAQKSADCDFIPFPRVNPAVDTAVNAQYFGDPFNGFAAASHGKHLADAAKLAEFLALQDATYFTKEVKFKCGLNAGVELTDIPPLLQKSYSVFDSAPKKVSTLWYTFNAATDAQIEVEIGKLFAGALTGPQFVQDMADAWSRNFVY